MIRVRNLKGYSSSNLNHASKDRHLDFYNNSRKKVKKYLNKTKSQKKIKKHLKKHLKKSNKKINKVGWVFQKAKLARRAKRKPEGPKGGPKGQRRAEGPKEARRASD